MANMSAHAVAWAGIDFPGGLTKCISANFSRRAGNSYWIRIPKTFDVTNTIVTFTHTHTRARQ